MRFLGILVHSRKAKQYTDRNKYIAQVRNIDKENQLDYPSSRSPKRSCPENNHQAKCRGLETKGQHMASIRAFTFFAIASLDVFRNFKNSKNNRKNVEEFLGRQRPGIGCNITRNASLSRMPAGLFIFTSWLNTYARTQQYSPETE